MRHADIDDQKPGRRPDARPDRRQRLPTIDGDSSACRGADITQGFRRGNGLPRRRGKSAETVVARMVAILNAMRQGQRLDPYQQEGHAANQNRSFERRRDLPARQPQLDEKILRNRAAARRDQALCVAAAKNRSGAVITLARVLVQRLDSAPKRRGYRQPDEQRGEIGRAPAPMA